MCAKSRSAAGTKPLTKPSQLGQHGQPVTASETPPQTAYTSLQQLYNHSPKLKTLCKPLGKMQYWPASSPLAEIKRDFSFNVFGVLLVTVFWLVSAFLILGALSYFESNWVATPLALFFFACTSWWLYERMRLLYSREMLLVGDKGALYAWQESSGRILRYKPLPYCQLLQVTLERGKSGHYVQLKRPGLNLAVSMGGDEAQCRAAYEALSQALHYFNYRNKSQ